MFGIAKTAEKYGHISRTYSPMIFARGRKVEKPQLSNHFVWGNRWENCIHYYLGSLFGINGLLSWVGTKQLLRDLDKFKPDIIQLHNLHNYTINLPLLFRFIKNRNISVVWTLHDCWAFTGHCPYFDMVCCNKWKTGCGLCPQKDVYPKTYFDTTNLMYRKKKKVFSNIENMVIVTPSTWLERLVKQSFLQDYPVKVIHNGIDLSVFSPVKSELNKENSKERKYILLGVAFDWGRRKGLDVFIKLSQRLGEKYQIVLVGTSKSVDILLPDNIISIHRTESQAELAELYSAADLFVNPTREENYPTVNMEALACGTPVLTFQTGGSAEIIDASCGYAVPCDDIDALESEIRKICEDQRYKTEACLTRAQSFDMNDKFGEYICLYETMKHHLETT